MAGLGTAKVPRKCAPDPQAVSLSALAGPGGTPQKRAWRRSFHLYGDRSVARTSSPACVLLALCLSHPAAAAEPASTPRATRPQVQQAVASAVKYLQSESAAWLNTRKCAACHHVPLPLW